MKGITSISFKQSMPTAVLLNYNLLRQHRVKFVLNTKVVIINQSVCLHFNNNLGGEFFSSKTA